MSGEGRVAMDHAYIEEQQLVDRYVLGTLPADEAERFEEHYLSCPECLDRLALAESMERGFKRAATQDAARLTVSRQLALVAWLSRLGRSRQLALLLTVFFVILVVPGLFTSRQLGKLDRELDATRTALQQERERSAAASRSGQEAARQLASERDAHARTAQQLAQASRPQVNVPILFLDAERGAGEPSHRLRLPPAGGLIVLDLVIDSPHYPSYQAVLLDARGREILRSADLRLNEREALSLGLSASLLTPGDYTVAVEGLTPGRRPEPAGRFSFRVLPAA
jgi:putative zinc finger protein